MRKLTSDTAKAYGLNDRGELRPGLLADLNLIDFDQLRLYRPEAIYDPPAWRRASGWCRRPRAIATPSSRAR